MKLNVDFSQLMVAVNMMEPKERGSFSLDYVPTTIDKLDLELGEGKSVELKDVHVDSGLLSYQGRQVILYIKANGSSARFHVADCRTLKSMRDQGRFERYVVTNDTSGEFLISRGRDYKGNELEGKARLKVCQNCLRQLNYKGCNSGNDIRSIVQKFDLNEFFATYSSYFPHMPQRRAETAKSGYTEDWSKVSSHYRVEKQFECEECKVNLREHRMHLHVHHISGVKTDNSPQNLKALCEDCHSKQPSHDHMFVRHETRQLLNELRKQQGLLDNLSGWDGLLDLADPGLHGVLHACRDFGTKIPELNVYVGDCFGEIVAKIEVAWPKHQFGVAISSYDIEEAINEGWTVVTADEFLTNYKTQAYNLRH